MKKGRLLAALLVCFMMLFLAACDPGSGGTSSSSGDGGAATDSGGSQASSGGLKIGISLGSALEERFERHKQAFISHANKLGIDLTILESESDSTLQLTQIESMINNQMDVLIVLAADSDASSSIGDMAKAAGIPLVSYNTFVMNCDVDYYVGYSDPLTGHLIAEATMDYGNTEGNIAIIRGDATNGVQQDMSKGFDAYMEQYISSGQVNVALDVFVKNWAADTALDNAENVLTNVNNDIEAFAVWNDTMAGGVVEALAEQGLAGQVIVTGGDMDIAAVKRIAEGTQTMTVFKPDVEICELALDVAVAVAAGEDPAQAVDYASVATLDVYNNGLMDVPIMMVTTEPVTQETLPSYLIRSGYYSLELVYENIPRDQWPQEILDAL